MGAYRIITNGQEWQAQWCKYPDHQELIWDNVGLRQRSIETAQKEIERHKMERLGFPAPNWRVVE